MKKRAFRHARPTESHQTTSSAVEIAPSEDSDQTVQMLGAHVRTQQAHDVNTTSMQRHDVASTLSRRCLTSLACWEDTFSQAAVQMGIF